MEQKALRGAGQMHFGDSLNDGEGMRKGRDFFQNLSEECYRNLSKYWQAMEGDEHLFMYSERQSVSYLMPALFTVTDGAAMCEMPLTRRKYGEVDPIGFLDYWAHYRGAEIAIEVKHAWYNMQGEGITQCAERWALANKQLKGVKREYVTSESNYLRLNLMLLNFWASKDWKQPDGNKGREFVPEHNDEEFDYHGWVLGHLKPTPNLWSYWLLPDEMTEMEVERESGKVEPRIYPAMAIYGQLELVEN